MKDYCRTKVVCTIGPASDSETLLRSLIMEGMDVARLNFSHGSRPEHQRRINLIRNLSKKLDKETGILLDTQGPEIRLGQLPGGKIRVKCGQEIVLTTTEPQNELELPVNYPHLPEAVAPGSKILIDDGFISFTVKKATSSSIICVVSDEGDIYSKKGLNLPGVELDCPAITDKDKEDIVFGLEQGVDFIALSFVNKAADILAVRAIIKEHGSDAWIIAKIENQSAVQNFEDILEVADGIMVARGDLGVELPPEEVPLIQKKIIKSCNRVGKPVITATQVLESMINNPRPTRAEASDIANAVLDGTDAIMLSGETAIGKYPVASLSFINRVTRNVESTATDKMPLPRRGNTLSEITDAISQSSCDISRNLQARAIITPTASGYTSRMVSKYRPAAPIIAATPSIGVKRRLQLVWGVRALLVRQTEGADEMINIAVEAARASDLIAAGDVVVITAGLPVGVSGTTNLLKVRLV